MSRRESPHAQLFLHIRLTHQRSHINKTRRYTSSGGKFCVREGGGIFFTRYGGIFASHVNGGSFIANRFADIASCSAIGHFLSSTSGEH